MLTLDGLCHNCIEVCSPGLKKNLSNLKNSSKKDNNTNPKSQTISPTLVKSEVEVSIIPRNVGIHVTLLLALKASQQVLAREGHSRSAEKTPALKQSYIYICHHR